MNMCGDSPAGGVILLLEMHPDQDRQIQNTRKRTKLGEQRRNKRLEWKGDNFFFESKLCMIIWRRPMLDLTCYGTCKYGEVIRALK